MKEVEQLTVFQRFCERYERFDNFCSWFESNWEDVALYVIGCLIVLLIVLFVLILCS